MTINHRSPVQPVLLSKMNGRQVLRTLLLHGPLSRAELARVTGTTPPTVSKAVETLLDSHLIEEHEPAAAFGRPARKLGLAARQVQVLGLVIDAEWCRVVSAGLDGRTTPEQTRKFPTPDSYDELLALAVEHAGHLIHQNGVPALGVGVSVPGLVDYRKKQSLLSPNVPITNGRSPSLDLEQRLGVECVLVQEEHALCLAERYFGSARGLDNFAMLDVSTGVGLGVMSGGRLLTGHSGLAGEVGHITVELRGRQCGCGNTGCLETVACDTALAWTVSQRLGRKVDIEEVITLAQSGELSLDEELETLCDYLAVGLAAVINLFNPSSLFVHGRLFSLDERLFPRLIERAKGRTLAPSFADCRIVRARGSKRQGALAGIIEHVIDSLVPAGISEYRGPAHFDAAPSPVSLP